MIVSGYLFKDFAPQTLLSCDAAARQWTWASVVAYMERMRCNQWRANMITMCHPGTGPDIQLWLFHNSSDLSREIKQQSLSRAFNPSTLSEDVNNLSTSFDAQLVTASDKHLHSKVTENKRGVGRGRAERRKIRSGVTAVWTCHREMHTLSVWNSHLCIYNFRWVLSFPLKFHPFPPNEIQVSGLVTSPLTSEIWTPP